MKPAPDFVILAVPTPFDMGRKLLNDLQMLVSEGVLSAEAAQRIETYYANREKEGPNLLVIIFSVLGALLIGLGIILILAHNWDQLSRGQKTVVAFMPLVIGQLAGGYTLWRRGDSVSWREASATFLVLSIGACIGLVSQIYHIESSMGDFLFIWSLVSIPVVYVLRSSMASLLYLIGITWYGVEVGYFNPDRTVIYQYWILLFLAIPYYIRLIRRQPGANATLFHHILIPLSVVICLGILADDAGLLMMPAYVALFGILYMVGKAPVFEGRRWARNPYTILGSLGILMTFFILSFEGYWESLLEDKITIFQPFFSPEMILATGLFIGFALLYFRKRMAFSAIAAAVLIALGAFILGLLSKVPPLIVINLAILGIGLFAVREGARENRIDILNLGLLTIAILIACRFFDIDLTFVTRGILFILLGAGFFLANYFLTKNIQKSISHESK